MSDAAQQNDEAVSYNVISGGTAIACLLIACAMSAVIGYNVPHSSQSQSPAQSAENARAVADGKIADAQVANQARISALQLRVVDACVKRDGVPTFNNGNVECRIDKPK